MGLIWSLRKKWQYFWGEIARVYVEMNLQDLAIYAYEQALLQRPSIPGRTETSSSEPRSDFRAMNALVSDWQDMSQVAP